MVWRSEKSIDQGVTSEDEGLYTKMGRDGSETRDKYASVGIDTGVVVS
jgi:hypothetical protein